jgi:endonuclease/exonuclease/phosphatase (EEP) superfamily protein YafD
VTPRIHRLVRPRIQSNQPARLLRRTVQGAGIGYAGAVLGYALLRPLLGERHGWIELADDLEPWTYLPAPAVALLGAVLGSSGMAAGGVAAMAAFGLRWGHRYLRRAPAAGASSAPGDLTVMTFNTLAWQREGRDVEASIAKAEPDIVGMQEIGPRGARHLATVFADRLPYHFITDSPSSSGAAVLSRFPLRDAVAFQASPRGHWWQRTTVDTPAGPITYLNVHTRIPHIRTTHRKLSGWRMPLEFHAEVRRDEVRKLVAMLDKIDGPIVVAGDFNMTERSPDYRLLAARLRDAYRSAGAGLGHTFPAAGSFPRAFPAPCPMLRLDYVWHSSEFTPAFAVRGDAGHSDHHPIVVGLRWTTPDAKTGPRLPLAASAV